MRLPTPLLCCFVVFVLFSVSACGFRVQKNLPQGGGSGRSRVFHIAELVNNTSSAAIASKLKEALEQALYAELGATEGSATAADLVLSFRIDTFAHQPTRSLSSSGEERYTHTYTLVGLLTLKQATTTPRARGASNTAGPAHARAAPQTQQRSFTAHSSYDTQHEYPDGFVRAEAQEAVSLSIGQQVARFILRSNTHNKP